MRKILFAILVIGMLIPSSVWAAISCSTLTQGNDVTNKTGGGSTYATASVSPSANALILVAFQVRRNGTDLASVPSWALSGNSLTWVEIDNITYTTSGAVNQRIWLFRAMGSSPSSGAITISWAAGWSINNATWAVLECSGTDKSGTNGSGAVVQSNKSSCTSCTGLTLSLSAFGSTRNATLATFGVDNSTNTITNEGGWTELAEQTANETTDSETIEVEWINANDTSPSVTFATAYAGGVGIEIKAAASRRIAPLVME